MKAIFHKQVYPKPENLEEHCFWLKSFNEPIQLFIDLSNVRWAHFFSMFSIFIEHRHQNSKSDDIFFFALLFFVFFPFPPIYRFGWTEARAEIVGRPIRYLTPGSTLKLMCKIVQNTEASAFIFWYHDNRMINYDVERGINVSTEAGKYNLIYIEAHKFC